MYEHIVLNEPHASMEGLYDAEKSFWNIDADFLNNVVIKWTAWHTDYLFHGLQDSRIRTVRFPYSRFIVDAERLWNDPMESIGQGIVYKEFEDYRRTIPSDQEQHLLNLWHWHQDRLRQALQEGALLLDCHSFPDDLSDVDICIGYNEDWSKPSHDIIDMAVNHFMDRGGVQGGRKLPIQQLGDSRLRLRLSLTDAGGKQEVVSQTWFHPPAR